MEPKEQALELVTKFTNDLFNAGHTISKLMVRHCTLITVDLLIKEEEMFKNGEPEPKYYWKEVKKCLNEF